MRVVETGPRSPVSPIDRDPPRILPVERVRRLRSHRFGRLRITRPCDLGVIAAHGVAVPKSKRPGEELHRSSAAGAPSATRRLERSTDCSRRDHCRRSSTARAYGRLAPDQLADDAARSFLGVAGFRLRSVPRAEPVQKFGKFDDVAGLRAIDDVPTIACRCDEPGGTKDRKMARHGVGRHAENGGEFAGGLLAFLAKRDVAFETGHLSERAHDRYDGHQFHFSRIVAA
ncbi:unnamed protein product [Rhizophagus irregularis]|uniref:Uncharacterized protein n=1 Tax=Rhizophagus irregularis TaxID=588596 RepID=A0A915ZYE0_9GLOM|nr:unnamed protein product [Rhizophagus irregularis]